MEITKELIVQVLQDNKTDLSDELGNVIQGIDATDFEHIAVQLLTQIQENE